MHTLFRSCSISHCHYENKFLNSNESSSAKRIQRTLNLYIEAISFFVARIILSHPFDTKVPTTPHPCKWSYVATVGDVSISLSKSLSHHERRSNPASSEFTTRGLWSSAMMDENKFFHRRWH